MQIAECRKRAANLRSLADDAPELEAQLLYVAQKWLSLATLMEQFKINRDQDQQSSSYARH